MTVYTRHHQQGFTLLEVLLVVMVIGLSLGLVMVSVTTGDLVGELEKETKDFANSSSLVVEESVMSAEAWGIDLYIDSYEGKDFYGYRWLVFTDFGWIPEAPRDMQVDTAFNPAFILELEVDGAEIRIDEKRQLSKKQLERFKEFRQAAEERSELLVNAATDEDAEKVDDSDLAELEEIESGSEIDKRSDLSPDIVITPSREVSPFILTVKLPGDSFEDEVFQRVEVDLIGRVKLEKADPEND